MTPLILFKDNSLKMATFIVIGIIGSLMFLPMFALIALANNNPFNWATSVYNGPVVADDKYDYGNCTYWTALKRIEMGDPIPNFWGNAATWAINAQLQGYLVDHTPSYGAIMQTPNSAGGLGHVAFVEYVNPLDGSWKITEMNVLGFDVVSERTLTASAAANYNFIHDKEGSKLNINL